MYNYLIRDMDGNTFQGQGYEDKEVLEWYSTELDCNLEDLTIIEKWSAISKSK
jgi:hypothetical protein